MYWSAVLTRRKAVGEAGRNARLGGLVCALARQETPVSAGMKGRSSIGRALVSKTRGWGFKSLRPCGSSRRVSERRFQKLLARSETPRTSDTARPREGAVNRETKRMLQRQGSVNADGTPIRAARQAPAPKAAEERVSPGQYISEVRSELKKVAWPTRDQIRNYTAVVVATLIIMTLLTFAYDAVFARLVLYLLGQ